MAITFVDPAVPFICLFLFSWNCVYGDQFLQVSLTPDAQLVSEDESVCGLRLSLPYGRNASVTGVDLGFVTDTTQDASALQLAGVCNFVDQNATGLQVAIVNSVWNQMTGCQLGLLFNTDNKFSGIGIAGGVNRFSEEGTGILIGGCGNYGNVLNGAQIGLCNVATYSSGLQIGVVNWAKNARGVQIGLVNYIEQGALPFMPILNLNFD